MSGQIGKGVESIFLLTPLREGRRYIVHHKRALTPISTHAPAGGATYADSDNYGVSNSISTHAPAGGATSKTERIHQARNISTHAPAGGATQAGSLMTHSAKRFLLTPLREGRRRRMRRNEHQDRFLLTPLREGRPVGRRGSAANHEHFYSRPCGRGDEKQVNESLTKIAISTHAPAGGATFDEFSVSDDARRQFLLTPLREGRHVLPAKWDGDTVFLLTPLREGRRSPAGSRRCQN